MSYKKAKRQTTKMEKLFNACEKKNCPALTKRNKTLKTKFQKIEKEKCSSLVSDDDFFNCSNKIYTDSGYEKSFKDLTVCNDKYCKKEKEDRANAYIEEFDYFPTPSFMKKGGTRQRGTRQRGTRQRGTRQRGTKKIFKKILK